MATNYSIVNIGGPGWIKDIFHVRYTEHHLVSTSSNIIESYDLTQRCVPASLSLCCSAQIEVQFDSKEHVQADPELFILPPAARNIAGTPIADATDRVSGNIIIRSPSGHKIAYTGAAAGADAAAHLYPMRGAACFLA